MNHSATSEGKKVNALKTQEDEIAEASEHIYAKYGNRLDLFFADVHAEREAKNLRQTPAL